MKLSPIQLGKMCQYCNKPTEKISSMEIYATDFGDLMMCRPCGAYVGCHDDGRSKGSVANYELREARKHAHMWFDPLWKKKMIRSGMSKKSCRDSAYRWLSKELGVHIDVCHIGMFSIEQCVKIIVICKPYYKKKK